jgi:hypothetical protein
MLIGEDKGGWDRPIPRLSSEFELYDADGVVSRP